MFEHNDRYLGLGCVILGILAYISASRWKVMIGADPAGPGGIPKILAVGIAGIGVILLVGSFLMKDKSKDKAFFTRGELMVTLSLTGISVAYLLLMPLIGYLIATPLLIASILLVLGRRSVKSVLPISLIATIFLFFLFYSALRVNLPLGFMRTFIDGLGLRL